MTRRGGIITHSPATRRSPIGVYSSVFLNAGIQKETEVSIPRMSYIGLQNRTGYWSLQEFAQNEKSNCMGTLMLNSKCPFLYGGID